MALCKGEIVGDEVNEKIYIAVGKQWKACKSSVEWTIRNSKGKKLCLVHVHQPAQYISILGGKFPVSSLSEQEVILHREKEKQDMCDVLDEYIRICAKARIHVEKLYIESETVESGLVELISQHKIERLVMGAAADRNYSRKLMEPKSKKANYVRLHAPAFCHIWFVCKARLIYTREGIRQPPLKDEDQDPLTNAKSTQFASEMSKSLSRVDSGGSFTRSSTFSLSQLSFFSRFSEVGTDSTLCHSGTEDRMPSFRSFALPPKPEQNVSFSNVEESLNDALCNQLDQAIIEAETAKREAFEESMRRRKAEKDAIEAIRKANAVETLYCEELRRRKEVEDELAKIKDELESTRNQRNMALDELRVVVDQKLLLTKRVDKSNVIWEELDEKLLSALELLQRMRNTSC
ncbi:unnamed protein product [Amaranthus hypochondriacus]